MSKNTYAIFTQIKEQFKKLYLEKIEELEHKHGDRALKIISEFATQVDGLTQREMIYILHVVVPTLMLTVTHGLRPLEQYAVATGIIELIQMSVDEYFYRKVVGEVYGSDQDTD